MVGQNLDPDTQMKDKNANILQNARPIYTIYS